MPIINSLLMTFCGHVLSCFWWPAKCRFLWLFHFSKNISWCEPRNAAKNITFLWKVASGNCGVGIPYCIQIWSPYLLLGLSSISKMSLILIFQNLYCLKGPARFTKVFAFANLILQLFFFNSANWMHHRAEASQKRHAKMKLYIFLMIVKGSQNFFDFVDWPYRAE